MQYECEACHYHWNEEDHQDNEELANGQSCPQCKGHQIIGNEKGEEE